MTTYLTAEQFDEAREGIRAVTGLDLTDAALAEIVDDDLAVDLDDWGASDTEVQGALANAFAQATVSRRWPAYGAGLDDAEYGSVIAEVEAVAYDRHWVRS